MQQKYRQKETPDTPDDNYRFSSDYTADLKRTNGQTNYSSFESVNRYYDLLTACMNMKSEFEGCFALKVSEFILKKIHEGSFRPTKFKGLPQSFYNMCVTEFPFYSSLCDEDPELLEIYMKQCVIIMREAGLITTSGRMVKAANSENSPSLYYTLFDSFWNKNSWDSLFPSFETGAVTLKKNRHILKNILLKRDTDFKVETVANDLFSQTGIAKKNDLFMISFIDFSLITWLNHFGIIQYAETGNDNSIYVRITETGRKILSLAVEK
jgi:hypothetical protein